MSAVDAPPGLEFAGSAAGEFSSRAFGRRLAKVVFYYSGLMAAATLILARRHIQTQPGIEVLLAAPILFVGVGIVGYAVRTARLRVDGEGVRWGWRSYGVRMSRERLQRVAVYADALALTPQRGSTWYVSSRDWHKFDEMARALRRAGIEYERRPGRAPLRARLQAFGVALDLLLLANAVAATFATGVAFAL